MKGFHPHLVPHQIFTGVPVTFDIMIYPIHDENDGPDLSHSELEATITDTGRLKFRQSELIEPNELHALFDALMIGIEQARTFAEADWKLDGDVPALKAFMNVVMRSGVTQKSDDLPEEGEEKALRVDYRIERNGEVIQTGMVDWQNGLYMWDGEEIDFWELGQLCEAIHAVTERCKAIMVDHRCWE